MCVLDIILDFLISTIEFMGTLENSTLKKHSSEKKKAERIIFILWVFLKEKKRRVRFSKKRTLLPVVGYVWLGEKFLKNTSFPLCFVQKLLMNAEKKMFSPRVGEKKTKNMEKQFKNFFIIILR